MMSFRHRGLRAVPPTRWSILMVTAVLAAVPGPGEAQQGTVTPHPVPAGEPALGLTFPPLVFRPPPVERREVHGVPIRYLHDPTFPVVDMVVSVRGGYGHLGREWYAAATALPTLLRTGGSTHRSPREVDEVLEALALQLTFGSGGGSISSSLNSLTRTLDEGLTIWQELLLSPGFDSQEVDIWRGQQEDRIRRRVDDPTLLAFTEFNRILYGDHSIGWELTLADIDASRLHPGTLQDLHERLFCRNRMAVGVSGDITWEEVEERLEPFLAAWPTCPDELPEPSPPEIRREAGVFLIPRDLPQTTVVMAHPTSVRLADDPRFFASRVANAILGAGGLSSRLMARLRGEEGLTYGASSLWTAPMRSDGLVGAITSTRSSSTVAATQLILQVMAEMVDTPPEAHEVDRVVDEFINGWVFNFESAAQMVSRQVSYLTSELPEDWLERYLIRLGDVTPQAVHDVFREEVRPEDMTILLVGSPENFDLPPETLGPVHIWTPISPHAPPVDPRHP
ncbi:MAG: pitrilysin family protein [Gemmatimonadota bacterium]